MNRTSNRVLAVWAAMVFVFLFLPIVSALRGEVSNYLVRIAELQWGLMICVFCASHVPALLHLGQHPLWVFALGLGFKKLPSGMRQTASQRDLAMTRAA